MLCVEDALDALRWAEETGGLEALIRRSQANLAAVASWVDRTAWVDFLARDPATRSSTSICLKFADPNLAARDQSVQKAVAKEMARRLEEEGAGFDLNAYRDAPAGLRLWGGATVERADLEALLPWLDWAYDQACQNALTDA